VSLVVAAWHRPLRFVGHEAGSHETSRLNQETNVDYHET
jgi:hypothetical protein